MERYAYIRVSSRDQNPERQIVAMKELDIKEENIFLDMQSGKNFERPKYMRMLRKIKKGDVIIIKSIDRLGRNYNEILEQWQKITKEKKANINVIDMPLLNTDYAHDNLTGVLISDLVLQILAYVAETERSFIRQRQAEGIAVAKAKGVKFGCPRVKVGDEFDAYYEMWKQGKMSYRDAAAKLGISYSTFYRRCKEHKQEIVYKNPQ